MILLPYKLDVDIYRIPFVTLLVCLICIATFLSQLKSAETLHGSIAAYCHDNVDASLRAMTERADAGDGESGCEAVFLAIRAAADHDAEIHRVASSVQLAFYPDHAQDLAYKEGALRNAFGHFEEQVPTNLTDQLAYRPDRYNVAAMVTSTFAHGSWGHLLGNLFFFFIFASCVESVIGAAHFVLCFLVMAIATSLAYSHSIGAGDAIPTIGLSGVAMGMMAMLTTLLPHAGIRCVFWFLLYIRRFTLPVLLIALWDIGWNIWDMQHDAGSDINYVAHVSGAVTGVALGVVYRVFASQRLAEFNATAGI